MVRVKPESEIETNYKASTALVPDRFERGVRAANWQSASVEGQDLYEQMMRMAEILHRRLTGIQKVSDEQWRTDTIAKGKPIIATRMNAASGKQITGYRPYREGLVSLDLPAKTTDAMQNLINRAGAVVQLMTNIKKSQG